MKITNDDLILAVEKAKEASNRYLVEYGENPIGCGFAWVVVKGARGKNAEMLKAFGFKKRYDGPGLTLWNPGKSMTQDMDVKYVGAIAFASVLREFGLKDEAFCRLD